jgi:hypothetical protein
MKNSKSNTQYLKENRGGVYRRRTLTALICMVVFTSLAAYGNDRFFNPKQGVTKTAA